MLQTKHYALLTLPIIAYVESLQTVTIAGNATAVQEIEDLCNLDSVSACKLKVQQAYHSHRMEPFAQPYRQRQRHEILQIDKAKDVTKEIRAGFSSAVTARRINNSKEIVRLNHWI